MPYPARLRLAGHWLTLSQLGCLSKHSSNVLRQQTHFARLPRTQTTIIESTLIQQVAQRLNRRNIIDANPNLPQQLAESLRPRQTAQRELPEKRVDRIKREGNRIAVITLIKSPR